MQNRVAVRGAAVRILGSIYQRVMAERRSRRGRRAEDRGGSFPRRCASSRTACRGMLGRNFDARCWTRCDAARSARGNDLSAACDARRGNYLTVSTRPWSRPRCPYGVPGGREVLQERYDIALQNERMSPGSVRRRLRRRPDGAAAVRARCPIRASCPRCRRPSFAALRRSNARSPSTASRPTRSGCRFRPTRSARSTTATRRASRCRRKSGRVRLAQRRRAHGLRAGRPRRGHQGYEAKLSRYGEPEQRRASTF